MKRSKPSIRLPPRRQSSTLHYQTFPTKPPRSRGRPLDPEHHQSSSGASHNRHYSSSSSDMGGRESPLPKRQLAILAVIALAEQTALNSISPYLPAMASTFPEVGDGQVGLYVGLIASAFALAQFATNFFWGWLSDRIGRKPVVLLGTIFTAACFVAFGFCKTLWQAILVQALMGLLNGNQGVVSTCVGEITDRSNQGRAFTYLPVVYGIGGITGPALGGLLVDNVNRSKLKKYPFVWPNIFSAAILVADLILTMLFLEESLEEARELPPLSQRIGSLFSYLWQFTSSSRPTYLRQPHGYDGATETEDETEDEDEVTRSPPVFIAVHGDDDQHHLSRKQVFTRDTVLLLLTFTIFQLSNVSYNSLYPIFAQSPPPTGRDLSPEEIGLSLAGAGIVTIVFQVGVYGRLRDWMGNKTTYRISLAGFVVAFLIVPWVAYKDDDGGARLGGIGQGAGWLWAILAIDLVLKTIAAVGGLTSSLLLITNSAPNHSVLGTLNGLAQTLSAAGRAVGPFVSGGLFSAASRVQPKGEALAFGVFAGVAFIGFLLSWGIRGGKLEANWEESDEEDGTRDANEDEDADADEDDEDDEDDEASESDPLLHQD